MTVPVFDQGMLFGEVWKKYGNLYSQWRRNPACDIPLIKYETGSSFILNSCKLI